MGLQSQYLLACFPSFSGAPPPTVQLAFGDTDPLSRNALWIMLAAKYRMVATGADKDSTLNLGRASS
jgi:hypothetical protein